MLLIDKKNLISDIESFLTSKVLITLGINKKNELGRLMYEIFLSKGWVFPDGLNLLGIENIIENGRGELFHNIKKKLLNIRYPSLKPGDNARLIPLKMTDKIEEEAAWNFNLSPRTIFVEKSIRALQWTNDFIKNFPEAEIEYIENITDFRLQIPAKAGMTGKNILYNHRRENIFLTGSKTAFIKMCPCSKNCVRCDYWVLNIGFGCPIDCAYCYLQTYSNSPGLVLPANIEDYYKYVEAFDKKVKEKVRMGTGEFTDSLALDKYTGYSSKLIPLFRKTKNLVLELKTKIGRIDNVLREKPHDNVVISWSMNAGFIAETYEKGGEPVKGRISAALEAARRGYKIGFHFDPIIFHKGWAKSYESLVHEMFSFEAIRNNTVWISLGTLRYTPSLKQAAEQRFDENLMFYEGEFFEGFDGKLRYPNELRVEMYNKMVKWIRKFNSSCCIYLCMEHEDIWKKLPLQLQQ
ncbi:MAG: radical SAM protein [Candidatus Omnitrophota bacterium]